MKRSTNPLFALVFFCFLPLVLVRSAPAISEFELEGVDIFQCECPPDKCPCHATIYIDQKANASQRDALTKIEQFLNGAYETSSLQASEVRFVPIAFNESSDRTTYSAVIPGILAERTFLRRDALGKPVSTETAMDSWANLEHYAENVEFQYHDKAIHKKWDHSGGYANVKYFHLTKQCTTPK